MILFPNCKINLGLTVVSKRSDGYHDLETVFYPLQVKDVVEVIEGDVQSSSPSVQFSMSGYPVKGNLSDNLCVKSYELLKKDFPAMPSVQMHLHKQIPMGAGLGGGSADGAFTLQLLNKKFSLNLSEQQLAAYALQLGSDCPFFITNKPCFATGRGENLELIQVDFSAYKFMLVCPNIHISTAWAFSNISPSVPAKSIKEIIRQPIESWKTELKNDFEEPVFHQYPGIKKIKEDFYDAGAAYASMSGSGSAVFGIFGKAKKVPLIYPANYFAKELAG